MKRLALTLLAGAIIGLGSFSAPATHAQGKMSSPPIAKSSKDHRASNVYVCKACKAYYPATAAKKMSYKDPMGHKLAHMDKAPVGYKDGSKMKMGTKM